MVGNEQTRQQTVIVVVLAIAVAATRLLALSRSLWDWDEALFCLALNHFDVAAHHPHPPGFPLYIALAKLMRLLISDDFRALRSVQLIASCFLFPSFYAMARAMRFPFTLAVSAALLYSFLPNVWYYGGTAFSDILSVVLFFAGAACLFGKRRYLLGTALFSLSLLVRPQNVLMSFPWFLATWPRLRARRFGQVAAAMALSIAIVAIGYGAAAYATGPRVWWETVQKHSHYIATIDGYQNPLRKPVLQLFPDFVIDPFEGGKAPRLLFGFAVAALFRPKRRDGDALATFVPFLIFAMFMLNTTGTSRHSLGYMPLHVLLAVDGMAFIGETLAITIAKPRLVLAFEILCVAVIGGRFITWTLPALRVVHSTLSPPVAAMEWVRAHVPRGSTIYVGGAVPPHADYFLARDYDLKFVADDAEASMDPRRNAWFVGDPPTVGRAMVVFRRERPKLWALFTRRYFETDIEPVTGRVQLLDGWYGRETAGDTVWFWMNHEGKVRLQPFPQGGELRFDASFPIEYEPPPVVTISVDGKPIDRFVPSARDVSRRYDLPGSTAPHVVTFDVNETVNLRRRHISDDPRDLGMQLNSISWIP